MTPLDIRGGWNLIESSFVAIGDRPHALVLESGPGGLAHRFWDLRARKRVDQHIGGDSAGPHVAGEIGGTPVLLSQSGHERLWLWRLTARRSCDDASY
ncbi:hypothetical protein [Nonomuraea dietziae]|uniref:hypothetical protein n=1 Tax=Nonomuraea dietziae TaxID=65515 RepID=UPI003441E5AF